MTKGYKKLDQQNTEHYNWGNNCDGWHFLKSDNLSVIKEKMPPFASEKIHYHHKTQQVFYVLSGIATFEVDDLEITVKQHEGFYIKPGIKHKIINKNDLD